MTRLGPTQRRVLEALNFWPAREAPPTPNELAHLITGSATHRSEQASTSAVTSSLRRLHGLGLVEKLGTSSTGARCWAITDAGRHALTESVTWKGERLNG